MVSETVSIAIEASDETVSDFSGIAADHIVGHVDATFYMVNQGGEAESLEVWFPLGVPTGFSGINQVQNFMAWVNEEPVTPGQKEVPGQWDYLVPRAIWNVTFPPGETVVLRVTYDLYPTGYSPYGTFSYILETGKAIAPYMKKGCLVVLESTTYPGTTDEDLRGSLSASGLRQIKQFTWEICAALHMTVFQKVLA